MSIKKKTLMMVLGAMTLTILCFDFLKYKDLFQGHRQPKYGHKIGEFTIKGTAYGRIGIEKGRWNLVLLARNLNDSYNFVRYINLLFENKFRDFGLNIILFTGSDQETIRKFRTEGHIPFPILSTEENIGTFDNIIRFSENPRLALLVNPRLYVEFYSDDIKEDDVRQLLEKCILGKINYVPIERERLRVGDFFPPIEVINVKTGETKSIRTDPDLFPYIWIIFSSRCTSCVLQSQLSMFSVIEREKTRAALQIGLIFSPYFNKEQIALKVRELGIRAPVYLAITELFKIEDSYFRSSLWPADVIVISTSPDNSVTYLESFWNFINDLKRGYFEIKHKS